MIEIAAANEKAILSEASDGVDQDSCSGSSSPPPSLESLSISTSSSAANDLNSKYNTEEDDDCASSVSSQDSSNVASSPKRSVFSSYWRKTGQKPTSLRPVRSNSTSDLFTRNLHTLSSAPQSLRSMSISDLLEGDGSSSFHEDSQGATSQQTMEEAREAPQVSSPQRRRSILPPAPMSHPALKSTVTHGTKSWRKSVSLSNVESYSRRNSLPLDAHKHKANSLPRMRSSSCILQVQPGPSCLRPYQKYSPSRPSETRKSLDSALSSSPCASAMPSSASASSLVSSSGHSRSSSTSSVSFLEAVDVRHFEPPRETYSGKGWSEYFN